MKEERRGEKGVERMREEKEEERKEEEAFETWKVEKLRIQIRKGRKWSGRKSFPRRLGHMEGEDQDEGGERNRRMRRMGGEEEDYPEGAESDEVR